MPDRSKREGLAHASCEAMVRAADFDRYLAALFAPADARAHLFAFYAFNHEIAHAAQAVTQPEAGRIRLQWWRDAVEGLYEGRNLAHPVLAALSEAIAAHAVPRALLETAIEARECDMEESPFGDMTALEAYADATSGTLMRLALRVLCAGESVDGVVRSAAIAYTLAGLLRALPFHAARGRVMLPRDALHAASVTEQAVMRGEAGPRLTEIIAGIARHAAIHLGEARTLVPRRFLPALLPAALVPLYLRRLTRPGFDPFRDRSDVAVHRRQLAMLAAMARSRL
jgi:phytoene/squalene synthetase